MIIARSAFVFAFVFASFIHAEEYVATRATTPPVIDGDLSDAAWRDVPEITGFTQRDPDEGRPASEKTVVKIVYGDDAIYFAAHLYDSQPVTSRLGRRDTSIESDWFRVYLDPHLDRRSGATFHVNPANVQYDAVLYSDALSDPNWDAVWPSAAKIVPDGWVVEMAIPFSQLRFPDRPVHTWGINLARFISRRVELSRLVFTPKSEAGFVSRFAQLTGIEGIHAGRRLELLPYTSARMDRDARAIGDASDTSGGAGLDVKYALTSNLTLTGTISPDFGQVEVDPARVNLTQFELFFPEKRPFFVEGASLFEPDVISNHIFGFNYSEPLLFYSRRIGPGDTTILGAGKVTGKTRGGWTLALLDAVTDEENDGTPSPLTNYLIARGAKDFGEKSSAGFRVTVVNRKLDAQLEPLLRSSAYAASVDGYRVFGDNRYVLQWLAAATRIEGSEEAILRAQRSSARYYQRPDADYVELDPARTSLDGYGGKVMFAKHAGKWQYNLQTEAYSPGFETNDAGFMARSDIFTTHAVLLWIDPDPWKNTRRRTFWISKFQHWNWGGDLVQNGLWFDSSVTFNNYLRAYSWGGVEASAIDDRATRGGPSIRRPRRQWIGGQIGTDTKRKVYGDAWTEVLRYDGGGWDDLVAVAVTFRPTSRVSLRLSPSFRTARYPQQYVSGTTFSQIDQKTLDISTRVDWTFTSRLSLQVYLQPYIATGDYHHFYDVVTGAPAGAPDPDFNYRSIRANAVLRWELRPGSSLYVVWNESREEELPLGDFQLRRDVRGSFDAPARDVLMVKVSYWLGV